MKRRYSLRKRHTISVLWIVIAIIVILVVMNSGYALWSSKLNIYGKVDLNFNPPKAEVLIPSTGNGKYTQQSGMSSGWIGWFDFVSDEYSDNSLTTTVKVHSNLGISASIRNLSLSFTIKNSSSNGNVYTDGKVTSIETSNPGNAVTGISAKLTSPKIKSNQSTTFNFSANVNRGIVRNSTYFKYAITFNDGGVTKYFFYTVKILPA